MRWGLVNQYASLLDFLIWFFLGGGGFLLLSVSGVSRATTFSISKKPPLVIISSLPPSPNIPDEKNTQMDGFKDCFFFWEKFCIARKHSFPGGCDCYWVIVCVLWGGGGELVKGC